MKFRELWAGSIGMLFVAKQFEAFLGPISMGLWSCRVAGNWSYTERTGGPRCWVWGRCFGPQRKFVCTWETSGGHRVIFTGKEDKLERVLVRDQESEHLFNQIEEDILAASIKERHEGGKS